MKKNTLWTKDFSLITITTTLSAIGGEALVFPIGFLVFEKTQSTLATALIFISGMLPDLLLSIIVAPIIDKTSKKKWIITLDIILMIILILTGLWIQSHEFKYYVYVIFTLLISTISVFYQISYTAWYPELIPVGFEQKGYAVSSTIYPIVSLIMTPLIAILYLKISLSFILYIVTGLTFISIVLESMITDVKTFNSEIKSFKEYIETLKEGFVYIKKEKGIRNIYTYMGFTSGVSYGIGTISQAYFQSTAGLSIALFGLLKGVEMIGRSIGGTLQYLFKIPVKKRFAFTKFVYTFYDTLESVFLFFPFPFMLLSKFLCGFLGTSSATIRNTAVQIYLPKEIRGRIESIMSTLISSGMIIFELFAGFLGEILPLRIAALIVGIIGFITLIILIYIPSKENRPIYEATREKKYK